MWTRDIRQFYRSVLSPTMIATGADEIYVTISNVPHNFILKRIKVIAPSLAATTSNVINIKVLSDAAAYRAAVTASDNAEQYTILSIAEATTPDANEANWLYDATITNEIICRDDRRTNNTYILLSTENGLSDPTQFQVHIWGITMPHPNYEEPYVNMPDHANLLVHCQSGSQWRKLETLNITNEDSKNITLFTSASDYAYFGLPDKFSGIWFNIKTPNTTPGVTVTWEYYDGSNWQTLDTIYDNCTNACLSAEVPFSYSGTISWDIPDDWAKLDLTTLGANDYEGWYAERTYGMFPQGFQQISKPKYWVRMQMDNISTQPVFTWIRRSPIRSTEDYNI